MKRALYSAAFVAAMAAALIVGRGTTTAATTVVNPSNMGTWGFFQETPAALGDMVTGPATPPLGSGSARLALLDNGGRMLIGTFDYAGTAFADIDDLEYSTYQNMSPQAISLQFDVDYDLTDANTSFQGRMVYEPYLTETVLVNTWQTWDPMAGKWWASNTSGTGSGGLCPQASPCTWPTVLANWPNAGVRTAGPFTGATILKAGGPGPAGFRGNVDGFTISISGSPDTYDFEPDCSADCYVRPDGNDANPGTGDTPSLAKRTIQAAVNQVSPLGTVHIASGTYDENVIVAKDITIDGAGQASTIVRPALSAPTCGGGSLCPGHSSVFLIRSSGVTISDLQVDGDNTTLTSGVVVGGADVDARNGIIEDFESGVYDNLHVHDVTVENIYLRGIYASSGGTGFIIEDNTVTNVQGEAASIAIFNFGGSGTIDSNIVTDANDAISSNWSTGTTYSNNTVTSSGSGVHSDNNGGFGGVADLIEDNTVTNCDPGGYGVWTFAPYLDITVRENTVTNCEVGLAASGRNGASPVTTSFIDNDVDGQNLAGSTGAYVTTDRFGFGDTDVHASFTGNKIRNNALGFQIDANDCAGPPDCPLPTVYSANVIAHRNDLSGNSAGAQTGGVGGTVNADLRINWWGSDTGPNHTLNPLGTGASVSDGIIYSPWLGIGADSAPAIGFQIASPMTWVVGPDVCAATCIQAAIDFSANGDTVKVKSGLFPEQIVINKDITVINGSLPIIDGGGSGDVVTITADGATLDGFEVRNGTNGVVLDVGADNVTVQNNDVHTFTSAGIRGKGGTGANINNNDVTGPHTGSCVGGFWGIIVLNTSGVIDTNTVTGIGNGVTTGCQEGRAIEAQGSGSLDINANIVTQYQKSGIIVRDTVASNITGNTTTGEGPTSAIAQNGITVLSTSTTLIDNNDTGGHRYTPEPTFSCGILYVPAGTAIGRGTIINNTSTADEVGICLTDAFAGGGTVADVRVRFNTIDAHTQRGIDVDGMTNVLVDDNDIDGQGQGTTATAGTSPDNDTRYYGIFVVDSTGVVSRNDITGVKHGLSNGLQSGVGIRTSARAGASTDVDLIDNVITDVQKNAIVVTNFYGGTVNADIVSNDVFGNGPVNYIAQNGIQLSSGATGTISGNTVQDYDYTPSTFAAAGILVIDAGSTTITNNIVDDAMEGLYIQNSTVPTVSGNIVTDSRDTAIFAVLQSAGTYSGNTASGSAYGLYVADSSNLSLTGNILLSNTAAGLIIDGASANNTATGNRIQFNVRGVDIQPFGSSPTGTLVNNNCIAGNTTAGMRVDSAVGTVNAENNWWGRVNGPNPPGNGDVIDDSTTVDASPFLTSPVAGCPVPADGDGDGFNDPVDNCPVVYNPSQANTNGEILPLPKPLPVYNDHTNPAHDTDGDACDNDIDGDGVPNATETGLGLSPYVWDTDGDRTNDGTELNCGTNPLVAASNLSGPDTDNDKLPNACETVYGTNPSAPDSDGDGVLDGTEVKYWMSNPHVTNTDGDNCADKREMASVNGDRAVNSLDQLALAQYFGQLSPEYRPLDTNGDGYINSADQLFLAQAYGLCAP